MSKDRSWKTNWEVMAVGEVMVVLTRMVVAEVVRGGWVPVTGNYNFIIQT